MRGVSVTPFNPFAIVKRSGGDDIDINDDESFTLIYYHRMFTIASGVLWHIQFFRSVHFPYTDTG